MRLVAAHTTALGFSLTQLGHIVFKYEFMGLEEDVSVVLRVAALFRCLSRGVALLQDALHIGTVVFNCSKGLQGGSSSPISLISPCTASHCSRSWPRAHLAYCRLPVGTLCGSRLRAGGSEHCATGAARDE